MIERGRDGQSNLETHSYILRCRGEPVSRDGTEIALRIRVEHVNAHEIAHFTNVGEALAFLGRSIKEQILNA